MGGGGGGRGADGQTDRQTDRQTEIDRDRGRGRDKDREIQRQRDRERSPNYSLQLIRGIIWSSFTALKQRILCYINLNNMYYVERSLLMKQYRQSALFKDRGRDRMDSV